MKSLGLGYIAPSPRNRLPHPDVKLFAALTLARVGEAARARAIADELEKAQPSDTILKVYWLPVVRSAVELNAHNASQALLKEAKAESAKL